MSGGADEPLPVPADEYRALYAVYLACLDARGRQERLPERVSDRLPDVKSAYARQGADEYGHKPNTSLSELLGGSSE
jgi:hypothetical protein